LRSSGDGVVSKIMAGGGGGGRRRRRKEEGDLGGNNPKF